MTAAVAPLAHQVAVRAQRDTRFAKVLDVLLTAPTTPQGTLERIAARTLSDQRSAALVEDFVDGSMRTPEVQALRVQLVGTIGKSVQHRAGMCLVVRRHIRTHFG